MVVCIGRQVSTTELFKNTDLLAEVHEDIQTWWKKESAELRFRTLDLRERKLADGQTDG